MKKTIAISAFPLGTNLEILNRLGVSFRPHSSSIIKMGKEFLENHILYFSSSAVQAFLREQNAKYSNKGYEFFSCLLVNKLK